MSILRIILCDQLSEKITSLENCDKDNDVILMCEVLDQLKKVKHHKKKIIYIFSSMRHFAEELKAKSYNLIYKKFDDEDNSGYLREEVKKIVNFQKFEKIIITHSSDYETLCEIKKWSSLFNINVEIKNDNKFLCSIESFRQWSLNKPNLRMEFFYRKMRQEYNILMTENNPIGGKWNFDHENRKKPNEYIPVPQTFYSKPDFITEEVISLVMRNFRDNFGDVYPFHFAVTRDEAIAALNLFIKERLKYFGDYQDAMIENQPWMYHSHLSFYINSGLLSPMECIRVAENEYFNGNVSLNSVEGFIRQIIGWREYIRGIYWLKMPGYENENFFSANRKLPNFYWDGNTKMNCIKQCVNDTKKNAYAHHIQRLMVLGNFALLAGIDPKYVNEWFLIVYADAYEWVELPNVSGMILFADGGYLGSKPYASGGGYINKMSNYCKNCAYDVNKKNGDNACPFNYLYWDFLERNRKKLSSNNRISLMYKSYDKMEEYKKQDISNDSKVFFNKIDSDFLV